MAMSKGTVQNFFYFTLHLIAIDLGTVVLCAIFKFLDMVKLEDVYKLHFWIGLGTFWLLGLQWLFGLMIMFKGSAKSTFGVASLSLFPHHCFAHFSQLDLPIRNCART